MERAELINHLEHLAEYVKYSEDAPALREAIALLKTHEERTETHACDLISMADVDQTVEDNILFYTHSDRPIDQDPDTECHKAIRTALKMLRKDLRKLSSAQPEIIHCRECRNWISHCCYERKHIKTGFYTSGNKYCAWAERREE